MKIHYFQHVPFEGLGMIHDWAEHHGHEISSTEWFNAAPSLPEVDDYDALIIMGGPMGVYDDELHWLALEKEHIKKAIVANKYILGICLGAQLIASALGAKVEKHKHKEIGWFPVAIVDDAAGHPIFSGMNAAMTVLHWHGDRFEIPDGALHLMASKACDNQAFLYGKRVLGLQFHLEMDRAAVKEITDACSDELVDGEWVQDAKTILEKAHTHETKTALYKLLDNWAIA